MKSNSRTIHTLNGGEPHSFYISHYGVITANFDFHLEGKSFHVKNTSGVAITIDGRTASMAIPVATTIAPYSWSEERFVLVKANVSNDLQYGY